MKAIRTLASRDHAIDMVRTVGVLAIVAGHVWDTFAMRDLLYSWHVPVFFFLTGYLWTTGSDRTVRSEITRRARSLLKPYVFWWCALIVPYFLVSASGGGLSFREIIAPIYGGTVIGRPFTTFWFVFVLFASSVLWRLVGSWSMWAKSLVISIAVLSAVFGGDVLGRTPLAIGLAVPALVFIAAGQYARAVDERLQLRLRLAIGVALLCAAAALILLDLSSPLDVKQGDWGTPLLSMTVAVMISWGLVQTSAAIAPSIGAIGRFFTWFAMAGFTVVLVHPAILWILEPVTLPWIAYTLAVLLPLAIGRVGLHTAASQWLTGVARLKRVPTTRANTPRH